MSLSHFRDLASNDETVRLQAAHSLLSELSSGTTETIEYALNRLIRGLASGRESSRIGFSVALTEAGTLAEFLFRQKLLILVSRRAALGSVAKSYWQRRR